MGKDSEEVCAKCGRELDKQHRKLGYCHECLLETEEDCIGKERYQE